ncbi:LysR family transcriptional regulator [Pannonibacter phragmitetus]|uniref:LysR family transcriptional regulator n=1 Tax=Pannonibacter phragmitetus TaxID=121719 RepID=UPI003D2EBD0B
MPYRPSHRQLEYLVAVAEHGHFGRAARACHVSQPTLSAQLKLLEDRLGVVLIDRGSAVVQPTPAGHALLPYARTVLETLDEFVREAQAADQGLGGLIRLGAAPRRGRICCPVLLSCSRNRCQVCSFTSGRSGPRFWRPPQGRGRWIAS